MFGKEPETGPLTVAFFGGRLAAMVSRFGPPETHSCPRFAVLMKGRLQLLESRSFHRGQDGRYRWHDCGTSTIGAEAYGVTMGALPGDRKGVEEGDTRMGIRRGIARSKGWYTGVTGGGRSVLRTKPSSFILFFLYHTLDGARGFLKVGRDVVYSDTFLATVFVTIP